MNYEFSFGAGVTRRGTIKRVRANSGGSAPEWLGYLLNDSNLLLPLGYHGSPEMADLIDVCLAIAICDRRAPRPPGDGRRVMIVTIPVRRPEIWSRANVLAVVERLLAMLTGDTWVVRFEQRTQELRQVAAQLPLFESVPALKQPVVVLHSGGLDSLLGMAEVLVANDRPCIVPVSVVTNSKALRVIKAVTTSLQRAFPDALVRSSYLRLVHRRVDDIDDREGTYRARILPCLAAGVVVAAGVGPGHLQLTENGPGAINLPTSPEQLDSWTTRATHPKTLACFEELATLVLARDIRIVNTGQFKTKGQLAMVLHDGRFDEAARLTVSCERFPYANANAPCGACMSCLYRQMALHRADMAHVDAERNAQQENEMRRSRQRSGVAFSALGLHLANLRPLLGAVDPYRELDAEFERIDEVLQVGEGSGIPPTDVKRSIVDLYREFVAEGEALVHANVDSFPQLRVYPRAS